MMIDARPSTSLAALFDAPPDDPLDVLKRVYGYDAFRGKQQAVVEHVVGGGDAVVLFPTGNDELGRWAFAVTPASIIDFTSVTLARTFMGMVTSETSRRSIFFSRCRYGPRSPRNRHGHSRPSPGWSAASGSGAACRRRA